MDIRPFIIGNEIDIMAEAVDYLATQSVTPHWYGADDMDNPTWIVQGKEWNNEDIPCGKIMWYNLSSYTEIEVYCLEQDQWQLFAKFEAYDSMYAEELGHRVAGEMRRQSEAEQIYNERYGV